MSQERIEAAAKAHADHVGYLAWEDWQESAKAESREDMSAALAAADAVMFSDEAIERAARALSPNPKKWEDFMPTARAVVAALKGDV